MEVILTHESLEVERGRYHFQTDDGTASLCGAVNEESQFSSGASRRVRRDDAERNGFTPCKLCLRIADDHA